MDDEYLSLDGEPTQTTTSDRKRKWKRKVARLRRESFTCGNPYVADYIRERRIKFDRPEVGCMRLNEHATIIGLLSKHDIGRPTAKALRACRVGSKCGLMFSILCRSDREKQEYALVKRVFGDVNAKHLAFETIIISAISGVNTDQIVQNVRIDIEAFRRKVRNFVQRQGQAWCAEMRKVGWFELEPYTISQIREALGGNSVKGRRKARLLVEQLGVDLLPTG